MSGYATIQLGGDIPSNKTSNTWIVVPACFVGFLAGLALVSTSSTSLFSTGIATATRAAAPALSTMPVRSSVPSFALNAAPAAQVASSQGTVQTNQATSMSLAPILAAGTAALVVVAAKLFGRETSQVSMHTTTAVKRAWVAQSGKKYKGVQPIIAPSLLAADLANLATDAKRVMDAGADVLHVDVMDGHFVPNLSWGAPVIKCLRQHSNAFFDTHLMVSNPEDFIAPMKDAGVDQFTFHIEAAKDPKALIKAIKDAGMKVGISVKPKTPVDVVFPYVEDVDLILVMTVEPGFGGQSFMEDMMPKVKTLREKYPNLEIQVDGGLSPKTIDAAAKAGANAIVAGSACFVADPKGAIDAMRESVEKYCTGPAI